MTTVICDWNHPQSALCQKEVVFACERNIRVLPDIKTTIHFWSNHLPT